MPTLCSRCAHYLFKPFGVSTDDGHTVGRQCPLYVMPLIGRTWGSTDRPQWGHYAMRLCTHDALTVRPLMCLQCHGLQPMGPHYSLSAQYAPTMCRKHFGVEHMHPQWGDYVPTMRSLCTRYVFEPFWSSTDGRTVGPLCTHYAHCVPSMC